jgi:hypothetical protein
MNKMKHVCLFVIIILSGTSLLAQDRIEGKYTSIGYGVWDKTLVFDKENMFIGHTGEVGGHSTTISKGYYLVKKDTLFHSFVLSGLNKKVNKKQT